MAIGSYLAKKNDAGKHSSSYHVLPVIEHELTQPYSQAGPLMPRMLKLKFRRVGEVESVPLEQEFFPMHGFSA